MPAMILSASHSETASFAMNGGGSGSTATYTSSLFGTASWATSAKTASYALNGGGGNVVAQVSCFPDGTFSYNGIMYNPAGSSTCGIQEAINMLPIASNYQTPGGGTIYFAPGIFYTSQSIVSPNTRYPFELQLFGAGIIASGIVMTGSNASGSVIDFGGGNFGAHTGSCGDKSFHMRDMFVASDLNTTSSLVYIRGAGDNVSSASIATCVVEHCWFGYWHSMITQDGGTGEGGVLTPCVNDDAYPFGSYVPVKHNLVGVTLDGNFTNNCIFTDNEFTFLAVGLSLAGDHLVIRDNVFLFIGRVHGVDNDWSWTSPYRIGAGIVLQESTVNTIEGKFFYNGNDNWRCQDNDFIGSDPSSSCYIFNSKHMFNRMVYGDSFELGANCAYIVTNGSPITSINAMYPASYYPFPNYLLPSTTDFSHWNSQPITPTFSSSLVKTWDMNWFNSYDGPFTFSGSINAPHLTGSLLGTASYALSSPGGSPATYTSSLFGTASWANKLNPNTDSPLTIGSDASVAGSIILRDTINSLDYTIAAGDGELQLISDTVHVVGALSVDNAIGAAGYVSSGVRMTAPSFTGSLSGSTAIVNSLTANTLTASSGITTSVATISNVLQMPFSSSAHTINISSPVTGSVYYKTDTNTLYIYNGTAWKSISMV